ncbi:MAG: hypothetical protein NTW29_02805 [Bacteroidetes bacterium]|nr:hypothetical protein [Bacteroidota bacterium]
MSEQKMAKELAALQKNNPFLPAMFHFMKPRRREYYLRSHKKARMINIDQYGTKEFIVKPFYKKISRIYHG